jgi:hypothetical protein
MLEDIDVNASQTTDELDDLSKRANSIPILRMEYQLSRSEQFLKSPCTGEPNALAQRPPPRLVTI